MLVRNLGEGSDQNWQPKERRPEQIHRAESLFWELGLSFLNGKCARFLETWAVQGGGDCSLSLTLGRHRLSCFGALGFSNGSFQGHHQKCLVSLYLSELAVSSELWPVCSQRPFGSLSL